MVGSKKTLVYETNRGAKYAFTQDESNSENVFGGLSDFVAADVGVVTDPLPKSPAYFRPRQARYVSTAGHQKTIIIPTPAIYADMEAGTFLLANVSFNETITGTEYQFLLKDLIPERSKLFLSVDTGFNDGDAT